MMNQRRRIKQRSFFAVLALAIMLSNYLTHQRFKLNQYIEDFDKQVQQSFLQGSRDAAAPFSGGKKNVFPSWAVVTQCSMYHTDCPNHLQFREYPFPLPSSQQEDEQSKKDSAIKTNASELIEDFNRGSFTDASAHLIGYEYPAKVDDSMRKHCIASAQTLTIEDQLDQILKRLVPLKDTYNMIAFSMTDETYAKDMLHEVYEMTNDIVGFKQAFFFVAMDPYTANMACKYGYPVVAMPENDDLKKQVQSTKVFISKLLVERGQPFLFYEMDVWFVRSPMRLL